MLRGLRRGNDLDVELVEQRLIHCAGGAEHEVLVALRLRKRDDVTDVLSAENRHHQPVDAGRDPTMRRDAVLESVEQVAELRADLGAALAGNPENAPWHLGVVDGVASARNLNAFNDAV